MEEALFSSFEHAGTRLSTESSAIKFATIFIEFVPESNTTQSISSIDVEKDSIWNIFVVKLATTAFSKEIYLDTASRMLIFLDTIEQGSFLKAAELRNINRSVVSKQIRNLEDELGVRLLNRTTRSISLTAAGVELIKKAISLRLLMRDTMTVAENFHHEPKGVLKVAAAPLIGRRYIQPVINEFQKQHPQVEIELNMDSKLSDIVSESVDIAIRIGEPKDSSMVAKRLARNRVIIAATPNFIKKYGEPREMSCIAGLPAATFVSSHAQIQTIKYFDNKGKRLEQPIKSVFRANDGEVLVAKVLSDEAYFAVPSFILNDEISTGKLVPILTHIHLAEYAGLYAVYPHRDLAARTRLFLDALCQYIGQERPLWEKSIKDFDRMYQRTAM